MERERERCDIGEGGEIYSVSVSGVVVGCRESGGSGFNSLRR